MTAVLGLVHNKKVYFGADSIAVGGHDVAISKHPKIFKNGKFMIGYAGSFRVGQVLEYIFKPPVKPKNMDVYCFMVGKFTTNLINCIRKNVKNIKEDDEDFWAILVAYEGRVFEIYPDYQCFENATGIYGIGQGGIIGRACLNALDDSEIWPIDKLAKSLMIAEKLSPFVRGPFDFLEM